MEEIHLKKVVCPQGQEVYVSAKPVLKFDDLMTILDFFKGKKSMPRKKEYMDFLLARRRFRIVGVNRHPLYGKFRGYPDEEGIEEIVTAFLSDPRTIEKVNRIWQPWMQLTFFTEIRFNQFTVSDYRLLKMKVGKLPDERIRKLCERDLIQLETHPRHGVTWTDDEREMLYQAMVKTNDLSVLAYCFGRSELSIKATGLKMLHEQLRTTEEDLTV